MLKIAGYETHWITWQTTKIVQHDCLTCLFFSRFFYTCWIKDDAKNILLIHNSNIHVIACVFFSLAHLLLVFFSVCFWEALCRLNRQRERQIHTDHTYIGSNGCISERATVWFWRKTHTHLHTNTPSLILMYCIWDRVQHSVWKVCPDDMMICSRKLMEHRAPEVPEPQRLLCRQPKAYLQAATSHAHFCLELVYIIVSSVTLGTETSKRSDSQRSTAFSSTKPEHIALQYWEYETAMYLLEVCVVPQR